jgi:hypothetical protein
MLAYFYLRCVDVQVETIFLSVDKTIGHDGIELRTYGPFATGVQHFIPGLGWNRILFGNECNLELMFLQ